MCKKKPFRIIGFIFLGVFGVAALGIVIMLLWNWLVPTLFAGPTITYWQALGLFLLSKLLLSGSHGGGHTKRSRSHEPWKSQLHMKLEHKRDEEGKVDEVLEK